MSTVPATVDKMIWQLADTDDIAAHADFVSQYPEFKDELERRSALVRRLRDFPKPGNSIPRFVPSPDLPVNTSAPKWPLLVAATVVLGGLAFATYAGVTFARSRQPEIETQGKGDREPIRYQVPIGKADSRVSGPGFGHFMSPSKIGEGDNLPAQTTPQNQAQAAPPDDFARWHKHVSITANKASLANVILGIASQAHVTIEIAKGMPDPKVNVEYHDQTAKDILEDLGRVFGFSVSIETDKRALLIPAVDPNAPKSAPAGQATLSPDAPANNPVIQLSEPSKKGSGQLPPASPLSQGGK